ncbi:DUF320 domain-containing protein [Streptomyces sp. Go40/10]|uniref:chaplin family protein n=1 Tax=Streptomyces sp. Go40/10 TaxID=2825844 RepID=UPI001E4C874D|nr:chaplin family protein [Streptomyces sp. Go40/10]UFR03032.1 DUF320 domain-containing protein [Streptomyces sp. Go40/10]
MSTTATALTVLTAAVGTGAALATPASAGGIGDFLSPAFGTSCANHHTRPHADGHTQHGTGTLDGNLAGLPLGSPLNHCGGADPDWSAIELGQVTQMIELPSVTG